MNAAEMPPSGPRIKMATVASSKWYPGEPMRGRNRLNPLVSGAGDVMGSGFAGLNYVSGNLEDRNSWRATPPPGLDGRPTAPDLARTGEEVWISAGVGGSSLKSWETPQFSATAQILVQAETTFLTPRL